jgi:hypothetical protein
MIGGIGIFLPLNPREAKFCVVDDALKGSQLRLSGKKNWSRYLKLPKQKRRMSILRNGSTYLARKLRKLQH